MEEFLQSMHRRQTQTNCQHSREEFSCHVHQNRDTIFSELQHGSSQWLAKSPRRYLEKGSLETQGTHLDSEDACAEETMRQQVVKNEDGLSLNQLLAGGPDRRRNNLAVGITKIRARRFSDQRDTTKIVNAIVLEYEDAFPQW